MDLKKLNNLTQEELAYIAGFLEGDGCLLAQIVKGPTYKYKHTIRIGIIFYQRKDKHWFFLWLKKKIGIGVIRLRKDNMLEYSIIGMVPVKSFLKSLLPFLILKKNLAILFFEIIEAFARVQTEADFLEVCKLVDKAAEHTYSKRRINTASIVRESLGLPVETEKIL
jgi:hypothetical protein